jgi:hypothetical protein
VPVQTLQPTQGGESISEGSKISKKQTDSMGIRSSKLHEVHLNKIYLLLIFSMIVQPFKIRVYPSVVDGKVIFYFSRVAK